MSIATLTNLIVTGASLSSSIYNTLLSGDGAAGGAELSRLFDVMNDVNTAFSRLLPVLLDPRRARQNELGREIDGMLEGCRETYEELKADPEGYDVLQLRKRLEAYRAGLQLALAVFDVSRSSESDIRVRRSSSVAVGPATVSFTNGPSPRAATIPIREGEDVDVGVNLDRVIDEHSSDQRGHEPGAVPKNAADTTTVIPNISGLIDQGEGGVVLFSADSSSGGIEAGAGDELSTLVAAAPNLKEVMPLSDTSDAVLEPTTALAGRERELEGSSEAPAVNTTDERNDGTASPHLIQPSSPNPKEIIDEDIRQSFRLQRSDAAPLLSAIREESQRILVATTPNIKENPPIDNGKQVVDEGKSLQQLPKMVLRNPVEQIGESSRSAENQPVAVHLGEIQPTVLPDMSSVTTRYTPATKPELPIIETEEVPTTTAASNRSELADPYTNTTAETSMAEHWRMVRASTTTSLDEPPSLKSDSSSITSLAITRADEAQEHDLSKRDSMGINTTPDLDLLSSPTNPTSPTRLGEKFKVTLSAILKRETKPPYSYNNFLVYMRDDMHALDLLDCWLDIQDHIKYCKFFVLERLSSDSPTKSTADIDPVDPTTSQISSFIRPLFSHPHAKSPALLTSPRHLSAIAKADSEHEFQRADLAASAEKIYYSFLVPGEADRDVTSYLTRETREGAKQMIEIEGRVDPEAFKDVWDELEGKMEKDFFPGFMKKRRVFKHKFLRGGSFG